jgi:protein-tyrosine phosphatase
VNTHAKIVMMLDCSEILESRLWVGSYVQPEDVAHLRQLGIKTVLSLQSDRDFEHYGISLKALVHSYALAGIDLHRFPIRDFDKSELVANLAPGVQELTKALSPEQAKVYVHCTAGVNRAPTLVAAYLMRALKLSARDAFDFVCMKRHCSPYLDVLEIYETDYGDCR